MLISDSTPQEPVGFNIIGYLSSNAGLGVSARHLADVLLRNGHPVAGVDIDPNPALAKHGHDQSLVDHTVSTIEALPHAITIVSLSIDSIGKYLFQNRAALLDERRFLVALPYWELTVLPPLWTWALELFDAILTPSHFMRGTYERHLSNTFTVDMPYPLQLPSRVAPTRSRFSLPHDKVLFVSSFDPHSGTERKNPIAVLDAFSRAFSPDSDTHLVIKINSPEAPRSVEFRALLAERLGNQVSVVAESMSYADVLSLYASCDVYVSLHRAEGLGLGMMEAMMLGKPVIATAWSGNMEFMTHQNACLVPYTLIPVNGVTPVYRQDFLPAGAVWADPDIDHAAFWMRELAGDAKLRAIIGERAAADMCRLQQHASTAPFVRELLALKSDRPVLSRRAERRNASVGKLAAAFEVPSRKGVKARLVREMQRQLGRHLLWRFNRRTG